MKKLIALIIIFFMYSVTFIFGQDYSKMTNDELIQEIINEKTEKIMKMEELDKTIKEQKETLLKYNELLSEFENKNKEVSFLLQKLKNAEKKIQKEKDKVIEKTNEIIFLSEELIEKNKKIILLKENLKNCLLELINDKEIPTIITEFKGGFGINPFDVKTNFQMGAILTYNFSNDFFIFSSLNYFPYYDFWKGYDNLYITGGCGYRLTGEW